MTPTRYPELAIEQTGGPWRFVDTSTGHHVGPLYRSKAEILADVERYAVEGGWVKGGDVISALDLRDEYREILKDILDVEAELEHAPADWIARVKDRKAKAWARAWEKFEP